MRLFSFDQFYGISDCMQICVQHEHFATHWNRLRADVRFDASVLRTLMRVATANHIIMKSEFSTLEASCISAFAHSSQYRLSLLVRCGNWKPVHFPGIPIEVSTSKYYVSEAVGGVLNTIEIKYSLLLAFSDPNINHTRPIRSLAPGTLHRSKFSFAKLRCQCQNDSFYTFGRAETKSICFLVYLIVNAINNGTALPQHTYIKYISKQRMT